MPQRSYRAMLLCLALLGFALDQLSKYVVFHRLYHSPALYHPEQKKGEFSVIGQAFLLNVDYTDEPADGVLREISSDKMPRVNHGALFGLGNEGEQPKKANVLFACVSLIAAGAILFWTLRPGSATDGLLSTALGLILGGTLGNLYDRVVFHGVRDFLYVKLIEWPVFNIADCCLVIGAGVLFVQAFMTSPTPKETTPPAAAPSVEPALGIPKSV